MRRRLVSLSRRACFELRSTTPWGSSMRRRGLLRASLECSVGLLYAPEGLASSFARVLRTGPPRAGLFSLASLRGAPHGPSMSRAGLLLTYDKVPRLLSCGPCRFALVGLLALVGGGRSFCRRRVCSWIFLIHLILGRLSRLLLGLGHGLLPLFFLFRLALQSLCLSLIHI